MHVRSAVICLLAVAGCTNPNPDFCCLSADSCAAAGQATGESAPSITNCTDPAKSFCTDTTATGGADRWHCIADPLGHACTDPSQCPGERPYCVDQFCVACENSPECAVTAPVCSDTNQCIACTGDGDCAARTGTPACDLGSGACVECNDDTQCNTVAAPVCDTSSHSCRACAADSECASGACDLESGECAAEADVIYLSPSGATNGTCTKGAPCSTFALGMQQVSGARDIIKAAAGTYTGVLSVDGKSVIVLGDGAVIVPGGTLPAIVVVSNGGSATIQGVTIDGATGAVAGIGVNCSLASTISLHRSRVVHNGGGGVSISGCEFSLVNDFIAVNGNPSTLFGGVYIDQIASGGTHELAFDSITQNAGATSAITGVRCGTIGVPLGFASDIVYGNAVTGTGTQVGGDSMCTWTYSDIGPQTVSGTGDIAMDPLFVDPATRDLHLMTGSPAIDTGDPASTVGLDIDGEPRPQGAGYDMGADEVTP